MTKLRIENAFELAVEKYSEYGVDVYTVINQLHKIAISLHCWQGDDVGGFERLDSQLGGGLQVTGNYPGKARNVEELRMDLEKAYSLIPGNHRLNLHAMYGEFGGEDVDRDQIEKSHFQGWIDWVKSNKLGLDFNATCFSHPKADDGFTLSSKNKSISDFWIEHVSRCREISAFIGEQQGNPCIHNLWIPDGSKDIPVDRFTHRRLLKESLDKIFSIDYEASKMKDTIESKLFGIGSEAFVVGSHDFYLGYGIGNNKIICLDTGHFHPTESVADKVSAVLQFSDELLLHVSRGIRWDSDHVVILNDDLKNLFEEIVRSKSLHKVNIALDFFDASINRIGAWVIGTRATLKALLLALLEPHKTLLELEENCDLVSRLALLEEIKTLPFGAVWDYYCQKMNVPTERALMNEVKNYEKDVLCKRI